MDHDLSIAWSARRTPQLRGVARREYERMADYFTTLMMATFLPVGCLFAMFAGDMRVFFFCGFLCFACVAFAVVVGTIVAFFLGKTDSGFDYRLDSDGLEVRMAGFSRLMTGVGAVAASTSPLRAGMAGAALANLSRGISWAELAEREAAVEVVPDEHVVILHEPWGRWSLFSRSPRVIYLFCETGARLVAVLCLIRQRLPESAEKAAEPNPWRRPLRITAFVFMLAGVVGFSVFGLKNA